MDLDDNELDDANGDGEGVWSPDIEQCFREALLMFPPCGRRKHILQEEGGGKMYGRNELIARHIMMRTGKSRTRKQVSSHIQVLARRKAKSEATTSGSSPASSSSAIGAGALVGSDGGRSNNGQRASMMAHDDQLSQTPHYHSDVWADRPIVTQKIRLVEFSAFIEYRTQLGGPAGVEPIALDACGGPISGLAQQQQPPQTPSSMANNNPVGSIDLKIESQAQLGAQQAPSYPGLIVPATSAPPLTSALPLGQQTAVTTHPLASNHHLPAQFNQASNYHNQSPGQQIIGGHNATANNHHQNNINNHNHHQHHLNHHQHPIHNNQLQPSQHLTTGFTKHSYVKIDYRSPQASCLQPNKLERIDISQIQDKFPEIGSSEGLFQRGSPDAFFLVKFWADMSNDYEYNIDDQNSYFGFSAHFETVEPYRDLTCSTKACSYGLKVVEKVDKIDRALNYSNGRYSFDIGRSPMCEFMISFIKKLRQLPRASQMNSVLENFTVLQVVESESTSEILLCLAYVFEVASSLSDLGNNAAQYHVYKLTRD